MQAALPKLEAVESRLRTLILAIVQRRASCGETLSWRLMFEIEDEAMELLRRDADLDPDCIRLLCAPPAPSERRSNDPVGMRDLNAMHTVLWMIQEAYYHR